jgi:hypothetical protein
MIWLILFVILAVAISQIPQDDPWPHDGPDYQNWEK